MALVYRPGAGVKGCEGSDRIIKSREAPDQPETPHWQHVSEVRGPSTFLSDAGCILRQKPANADTDHLSVWRFISEFASESPMLPSGLLGSLIAFYLVYISVKSSRTSDQTGCRKVWKSTAEVAVVTCRGLMSRYTQALIMTAVFFAEQLQCFLTCTRSHTAWLITVQTCVFPF